MAAHVKLAVSEIRCRNLTNLMRKVSYFDNIDIVFKMLLVFGVSRDSVESHKSFAEEQKLTFPLLSDEGSKVRKLYGVPKSMFIMPGRCTYVIGPDGIVRHIYNSQLGFATHVEEAKKALEKIRNDAQTAEE